MSSKFRSARAAAAAAATLVIALVVPAPPAVAQAPPPPPATPTAPPVQVIGKGWGHGRGMGQFGALGYALQQGWSYEQILDHYYGGTELLTLPDRDVAVRITSSDDRAVTVMRPDGGVTVAASNLPAQVWPAVRATPNADGSWTIDVSADCHGTTGWAPLGTVSGTTTFTAPGMEEATDPSDLLSVCQPDGLLRAYRGSLQVQRGSAGEARLVNVVSLERYLRGVVPRESPASWGDLGAGAGMHALRAQAVAARSYASVQARYSYAGTCDSESCQVYRGVALGLPGDWTRLEDARTSRAIAETAGQVRGRNGQAVSTEYSSSTGGYTAGGTFPAVPDDGDAITLNPNANWSTSVTPAAIQAAFPQVGTFRSLAVTRRNGLGAFGGRADQVQVRGDAGQVAVSGNDLRRSLGLKSDWFRVSSGFLSSPAAAVAQGQGSAYWVAGSNGSVLNAEGAGWYGSLDTTPLNGRIVAASAAPDGKGYWMVGSDGGVFTFGSAAFFGSTGGQRLNRPIVGMAPRPQGDGYWFVGTDGGVFTFGSAPFAGSTGAVPLNQPIIGMAATASGGGYWLVARDGGVFTFGDATFFGSTGDVRLNQPIVGMAVRPQGDGYWFVAADGGVFAFGAAPFLGSLGGQPTGSPIVGMAVTASGQGYRLVLANGTTFGFGDAATPS